MSSLDKTATYDNMTTLLLFFFLPGTPDLFSYAQTSSFAVRYLGKVSDVTPQINIGSSESQISTLEDIEVAQVRLTLAKSLKPEHY